MIHALSELPVTAEKRLHKDLSLHIVKNNFLPSALKKNPLKCDPSATKSKN